MTLKSEDVLTQVKLLSDCTARRIRFLINECGLDAS